MYKACHTQQSSQRQRQIAEVFLDLIQETPVERLRVADLCRAAGVPRKVFYRYFDGKEDVLSFLTDTLYIEMQLQIPRVPFRCKEMQREDCLAFFQFWGERKNYLNVMMADSSAAVIQKGMMQRYFREYPLATAEVEGNWRLKGSVSFLVSGLMGLLQFWKDSAYRQTPEEMGRLLQELLE